MTDTDPRALDRVWIWLPTIHDMGSAIHAVPPDEGHEDSSQEYVRVDLYTAALDRAEKAEADLTIARSQGRAEGLREAITWLRNQDWNDGHCQNTDFLADLAERELSPADLIDTQEGET